MTSTHEHESHWSKRDFEDFVNLVFDQFLDVVWRKMNDSD